MGRVGGRKSPLLLGLGRCGGHGSFRSWRSSLGRGAQDSPSGASLSCPLPSPQGPSLSLGWASSDLPSPVKDHTIFKPAGSSFIQAN